MATTVTYDKTDQPKVTLTKDDDGNFLAVVEVDGLAPVRTTSAEERAAGITSIDPPTVRVAKRVVPKDAHNLLINLCCRAVSVSATSTLGTNGGPGGLIMGYLRVAMGVRGALRELGEDI